MPYVLLFCLFIENDVDDSSSHFVLYITPIVFIVHNTKCIVCYD